MAKSRRASTAKGTNKLPSSAFAYPKLRKYPINTAKRQRAALSRAAQKGTYGTYAHVAKRIRARGGKVKSLRRR